MMYFCFILANSADPDEMQHYAAFHLGFQCLPKNLFRGFQYTKVNVNKNLVLIQRQSMVKIYPNKLIRQFYSFLASGDYCHQLINFANS